ncbi:MAG TPA: SDR family oxidoreductase [Acidobacteriota bacterium]|jgi:NAD(P)-dependent dehydrogenase (short-subunit alcohol dehydrogenase family)
MQIQDKCILVTGAARRVGRVIALHLAAAGAEIALHYNLSRVEAETTARDIEKLGGRAETFQCNLREVSSIQNMVDQVYSRFGQIDVLVNNAAVFFKTPFDTVSEPDWDLTIESNLKGPFFLSLFVGRRMLQSGHEGRIINIADWAGERPYVNYIPYCISKAGVIALTKGLAKTLAPRINVMAIAPGPVLWPDDLSEQELQSVLQKTPLRRLGTPEDVARAVAFIIEGGDYMTGTLIYVDGGRLVY